MNINFQKYVGHGCDDGMTEADMPGYEYLNIRAVVDGELEGSLSGWFKPEIAAHIRKALFDSASSSHS